jgi:hypothetical protein
MEDIMTDTDVIRPRGEYASPLTPGITSGRLVFERGTANDLVLVDPGMDELFLGRFDGAVPRVEVAGGTVRIRHSRARRNRGRIALSGRVPWSIELRGGAARLRAELAEASVSEIVVGGGASHVDLHLPVPTRRVPIRFAGGVSHLSVLRPKGVPVHLSLGGGAARIALDCQRFAAVGGPVELSSGDPDAPAYYDIQIGGGAHALVVATA